VRVVLAASLVLLAPHADAQMGVIAGTVSDVERSVVVSGTVVR
jgi:hypothetical protein